jgi:hypothetical protein
MLLSGCRIEGAKKKARQPQPSFVSGILFALHDIFFQASFLLTDL